MSDLKLDAQRAAAEINAYTRNEQNARKSKTTVVPAELTNPATTPERRAAAERTYVDRLLGRSPASLTAEERQFLQGQISNWLKSDRL